MTDQQIENMRGVMSLTFGPYAFMMPKEEVIKFRDMLQNQANELDINIKATRAHELIDLVEISEEEIEELHSIVKSLADELKEIKLKQKESL